MAFLMARPDAAGLVLCVSGLPADVGEAGWQAAPVRTTIPAAHACRPGPSTRREPTRTSGGRELPGPVPVVWAAASKVETGRAGHTEGAARASWLLDLPRSLGTVGILMGDGNNSRSLGAAFRAGLDRGSTKRAGPTLNATLATVRERRLGRRAQILGMPEPGWLWTGPPASLTRATVIFWGLFAVAVTRAGHLAVDRGMSQVAAVSWTVAAAAVLILAALPRTRAGLDVVDGTVRWRDPWVTGTVVTVPVENVTVAVAQVTGVPSATSTLMHRGLLAPNVTVDFGAVVPVVPRGRVSRAGALLWWFCGFPISGFVDLDQAVTGIGSVALCAVDPGLVARALEAAGAGRDDMMRGPRSTVPERDDTNIGTEDSGGSDGMAASGCVAVGATFARRGANGLLIGGLLVAAAAAEAASGLAAAAVAYTAIGAVCVAADLLFFRN